MQSFADRLGAWWPSLTPRLLKHADAYTRNRADSEDLVSDCCLKALETFASDTTSPQTPTELEAWAHVTLDNLAIDFARHRSRLESVKAALELELSTGANATNYSLLYKTLTELPDRQGIAIRLKYWGGLTEAEIAEILGIETGAAHALLVRARAKLRKVVSR